MAVNKVNQCNVDEHIADIYEQFETQIEEVELMRSLIRGRTPDAEETAFPYKSGELMSYYWDWQILYCLEEIFDCMSGGIPHKHAVNRIIARRYGNDR